jgi:hypothetical protein
MAQSHKADPFATTAALMSRSRRACDRALWEDDDVFHNGKKRHHRTGPQYGRRMQSRRERQRFRVALARGDHFYM